MTLFWANFAKKEKKCPKLAAKAPTQTFIGKCSNRPADLST